MRVNWVTKMFIYFVILTLAGPYFDNWATTEKLLFLSDAYVNNCPKPMREGEPTETYRCESQKIAVSGLISYARMFEFFSSMPLGICVDRFGPRFVCVFGVVMCIGSWLLLAFLPKYGSMLTLSMIMIGISTNAITFPGITIELYTKKYKSQVIIFICSSTSITCFVVKLVEIMARRTALKPRMVVLLFVLIGLVPSLIATYIFFPDNIKKDVRKIGEKEKKPVVERKGSKEVQEKEGFSLEAKRMTSTLVFEAYTKSISDKDQDENESKEPEFPETSAISRKNSPDEPSSRLESRLDLSSESTSSKWNWRGFMRSLKSVEVVLCSLYYCLNVIGITYCQQSYTIVYSENSFLLQFMEYVLPFSFLSCIFFMVYMKFFTPFYLLMTIGVTWACLDLSSIFQSYTAGITSAILFTITYSIFNTHVNVYLESRVNKDYFSSILGFVNTAGGVSLLFNILLIRENPDVKLISKMHTGLFVTRVIFLLAFSYLNFREVVMKRLRGRKFENKTKLSGFESIPDLRKPTIPETKGDSNHNV